MTTSKPSSPEVEDPSRELTREELRDALTAEIVRLENIQKMAAWFLGAITFQQLSKE